MFGFGSYRVRDASLTGVSEPSIRRQKGNRRVIFANGDSVHVIRVAPWLALLSTAFILLMSTGVIGSAVYLFFRDELFTASIKRQHQIQVAYEDRVAELRREIDRIASRQLLNQQGFEARIDRLLQEQAELYEQGSRLDEVIVRAGHLGLAPRNVPPPPVPRDRLTALPFTGAAHASLITGSTGRDLTTSSPAVLIGSAEDGVDATRHNQLAALTSLAVRAREERQELVDLLEPLGLSSVLPDAEAHSFDGVGGPLLPPEIGSDFDSRKLNAERALIDLEAARAAARSLPIGAPTTGARLSSRFGNRIDPFTRRRAFHSGIDFAAPTGHPIYAAADGRVVRAGRSGGYGRMIEIEHAHGIRTRYAHLHRISVNRGDRVAAGELIGRMGSTGRSTGPHLHYEVRRGDRAVDPMHFLNAGRSLLRD